jgi:YfiH family protein
MRPDTGRGFPDLRVISGSVVEGVRYGLTTSLSGSSQGAFAHGNMADHVGDAVTAVERNRADFVEIMEAPSGLAVISAEHGASVAWASAAGTYLQVDALLTDVPGLAVVALGADCAVIGLSSMTARGKPVVGVVHCGWKGLVADVIGAAVSDLREFGGHDLRAVIGPAICGNCYVVGEHRADLVEQACSPEVSRASIVRSEGSQRDVGLDIRSGVRARLTELGVEVDVVFGCSYEDERWYSYRRASQAHDSQTATGRHALAMIIDE